MDPDSEVYSYLTANIVRLELLNLGMQVGSMLHVISFILLGYIAMFILVLRSLSVLLLQI